MQSTKLNALKSLASLATFRKLAVMAALLAAATALILISTTTQAQASNGAVPNLQLSSASPSELTIAWDAPDPTPSDYRIVWAKQDLDFPSYSAANEANRSRARPFRQRQYDPHLEALYAPTIAPLLHMDAGRTALGPRRVADPLCDLH